MAKRKPQQLLSTMAVARALNVSRWSVRLWRIKGWVRAQIVPGYHKQWGFPRSEMKRILAGKAGYASHTARRGLKRLAKGEVLKTLHPRYLRPVSE